MKKPRDFPGWILLGFLASSALAAAGEKPWAKDAAKADPRPPVILNEIHYHPSEDADDKEEFVELHNRTDAEVDLEGWSLRGGISYRFSRESGPVKIAPKEYLVVARNPEELARVADLPESKVAGPFEGRLSNHEDRVVLRSAEGAEVDSVKYSQGGLWPARADGMGPSLQRVSSEDPGNLPQNWSVAFDARGQDQEHVLFQNGAAARWFENLDGNDPGFQGSVPWWHPDFDDERNGWRDGRIAVGFDVQNRPAQRWILTDATPQRGLHSILVRIPFEVPEGLEGSTPILYMDWDDGFIAWLNGAEITRKSMKLPPGVDPPYTASYLGDLTEAGGDEETEEGYQRVWTGRPLEPEGAAGRGASARPGDSGKRAPGGREVAPRPGTPAPSASRLRLGASRGQSEARLKPGRNILAIGNYNYSARSSDLFSTARLTLRPPTVAADWTPGARNSVAAPSMLPLVTRVQRSPEEPTSADSVIIRARVEGKAAEGVQLFFKVDGPEDSTPMHDDGKDPDEEAGDGIFSGEIPPQPCFSVVRFRIEARDDSGVVGRSPREHNPSPHAGYHVLDERPRSNEDLLAFHLLWNGELKCAKGKWLPGCTFIHRGTAHLDVRFKLRGDTSCGHPKSGIRIDFNKGDYFEGQKKLNLLACWEDRAVLREKLAWDLFRDIGHPFCRAETAAVYTWGGRFHGLFVSLEDPGENYLRRNGLDPSNALWKCRNSLSQVAGAYGGMEKLTSEERTTDDAELAEFGRKLNSLEGHEHLDFLLENFDVEAFIDYQAVKCLISDEDGYEKNWLLFHGVEKDSEGRLRHRWTAHAWDMDLSFGQIHLSNNTIHTTKHPLMGTQDHLRDGSSWNGLVDAVFGRRSKDFFVKALYGRLWRLLEEKFNPEVLGAKINRISSNTDVEARRDLEQWPRWGSMSRDCSYHRTRLQKYVTSRTEFLRRFLTSENPTVLAGGPLRFDPLTGDIAEDDAPVVETITVQDGKVLRTFRRVRRTTTPPATFRYVPGPRMKITEICYHPEEEDLEFLEIKNLEEDEVDISGWSLPAVDFVFPEGARVAPKALFILARSPQKLLERHEGLSKVPVFGPYSGKLANEGEHLRLRDSWWYRGKRSFPETIDSVKYLREEPWPTAQDARGKSIELRSLSLDNDYPASWQASRMKGGTPGVAQD